MITYPQSLADAYVLPARNISMPSTPGRTVRFLQGHAVLKVDTDLMAMMRRNDVKIVFTPYSMSWLEGWMAEVGERLAAELLIPDDLPPPEPPAEDPPDPNMDPQISWDPTVRQEMQGGADSTGADPGTV
jgi:hypothetical protein